MAETAKQQNIQTIKTPVVVVLGHIDHGKTSLLMAIKDFKVLAKESGGITQHVGAYEIEHNNRKITFIDTPGHEAFSAIRARGSKIADIAILVIDAAEGLKKQTREAIELVKKDKLPLIVAINKMDKPDANPEMVKRQLADEEIYVESMGGTTPAIEMSAKTGKGINDLLDMIQLVGEMAEFKADSASSAEAAIIEAYLDSRRGPTVTAIVEKGILRPG
ncbi:MAG: GTP-binding protein, partial [Candidatus Pacebacteria bacterium]|nr:GTP-binding protein [Candidatus Paceibacterota bacterium]